MHIASVAVTAVVTFSVVGASYAVLSPSRTEQQARLVADRATCRAVESAIVAYVAQHDTDPVSITQLAGLLDGDISRYRLVRGRAAGPGC